ncbi:FkbM family methyltransferase [Deferribacteraceae bacterium V6Fe1]|nr:FkbM family methyltransferase [Deferribacteraceae bacterium V6Fe1]
MKNVIYTKVPNFGNIELIDYYDEFLWYYPDCELETKKWVTDNCKDDWIILDCGANIGYYTILFAKLANKGYVYAFEPTDTIVKLKNNLEYHKITNVKIIHKALADTTCVKRDKIYKIWGKEAEFKSFEFITIDDFIEGENVNKIDLIKIDVDSYDFEVLKGAEKTLKKFNPFVIVELNHALSLRNTSIYHAIEWMKNIGYDKGSVLDHENIIFKKNYEFVDVEPFTLLFKRRTL